MGSYDPPIDQLLKIEDDLRYWREWHDYRAMGIGPEHVMGMIRMVIDDDLNNGDSNSTEVWGPVHAWRALGTLRAELAIPVLVGILANQRVDGIFDDWITEDFPKVLGMIGAAALPSLTELLQQERNAWHPRVVAARAISQIAQQHPEARDECVALLSGMLERAERNDPALNGLIVSELLNLDATEAVEAVEKAYADGHVDESICGTWYDVWHEFELEGEPPPKTEQKFRPNDELIRKIADLLQVRSTLKAGQTAGPRRPDGRKERNKARQKLEKKIKGKGGKRR